MSPAPQKPAPVRFGIAARLSAAFLGLAGLAAVAGASSSWFSLQSAGIVSALGSRTLPTVTASLSFARQNAILAAEAPGLASQTSLGGLAQHAEQIDGMLAAQAEGLARLRGRVGVPDQLEAIERHNRDLAPKIADLKAAAAERIGVADKMQVAVGEALSRYQDLMDFVRPLQEALQTAVGGDIDALGKGNSGATQTLATDLKTLQAAMDVQANANLAFGMLSAVANASDSALSDIGTQYNWAEVYLGKGLKAFGSGADADRLAPLVKALLDIGAGPSGVFTLRNQATDIGGRVNGLLNDLNAGSAVLSEDVKVLVHTEEDLAQKAVDRSAAVTRQTLGVNAATSGLVIVAALLIGIVYVRRSITRRLIRLAGVMGRLAAGDRTATVATGGRDEITAMAAAVGVFRDNMLAADRLAGEASRLTAQREAERAATERERALAAEQQATVVQGLARGLTDLAHGKLSQEIVTPFAPDYESLRLDFNDALGRLRAAMREVVENADQLRSGTDEIAGAADDLSRRTENQAASLEQTAAALGEVTGALRKTADGAIHARDIVGAAKAHVEQSGKVIQDAVAAMGAIEASSGEIGQIIGVVDEIAFQTSLLALNAGVEAARAGEAGRGFAVVASEVRTLAQRSAEAAKQIKALVSASRTQVSHGVALVGQGGIALERVLSEVSEINAIVSEIARAAGEQTLGLEQVNVAVTQMDQVTQQNAAMVEETNAASHHLAQEIAALTRSMGRFQLGDAAPAAVAHPPRQAASRPTVASRGRTGGAATALMAEADEGWSEF